MSMSRRMPPAASSSGRSTAGAPVAEGAILFRLDDSDQKEAVAGAEARLAQAEAQLANLRSGKRPEEIAVLAGAARRRPRPTFSPAERRLHSASSCSARRQVVAQSAVDDAKAERDTAQAQRRGERTPARRGASCRRGRRRSTPPSGTSPPSRRRWRRRGSPLDRRDAQGAGEPASSRRPSSSRASCVSAGQPVVSLLPDANRKAASSCPSASLAGVKIGDAVAIACDGCAAGPRRRRSTFIATEAEFTPPVIYSQGEPREARLPRRGAAARRRRRAQGRPADRRDACLAGAGS